MCCHEMHALSPGKFELVLQRTSCLLSEMSSALTCGHVCVAQSAHRQLMTRVAELTRNPWKSVPSSFFGFFPPVVCFFVRGNLRMLATLGSQVQISVDGPYGFPLEVRCGRECQGFCSPGFFWCVGGGGRADTPSFVL